MHVDFQIYRKGELIRLKSDLAKKMHEHCYFSLMAKLLH